MQGAQEEPESTFAVLVADDDWSVRSVLADSLKDEGFRVVVARNGKEVISQLSEDVAVALLDLKMPEPDGIQCLEYIKKEQPDTECIMITASVDVGSAVQAMKNGAFEYLTKPVHVDELVALVHRASNASNLRRENRQLRQAISLPRSRTAFVGQSAAARRVLDLIQKVAELDSTVLITGESGVGKGLVARMIHDSGPRRDLPLVTVSCTALPRELVEAELFGHEKGAFTGAYEKRPGKVEMANGGTLLLDEVGDMPLDLQPKLLTVLQDRVFQRIGSNKNIPVDVRVIAATHRNLGELCQEKRFREDLYFRLDVLPIHIAALRERREDIQLLVDYLLGEISNRRGRVTPGITNAAMDRLKSFHWPGNIRQLENVLERVTAFTDSSEIGPKDLPAEIREGACGTARVESLAGVPLLELERAGVAQTLELCEGNRAEAARRLGVSEKTIYNMLKRHGLS